MDFRPAMVASAGIGRYVAGLAGGLAPRCDLRLYGVFLRGNHGAAAPPESRLVAWRFPARVMNWLGRARLLTTDRALGGCDVFHHTDFVLPEVAPGTPQVMTLHDLAFLRAPETHTPLAVRRLGEIVRRARDRCAAFLVPSEATARDCRALLGVDPFVTPLGVDESLFALPPARPARRYLLAVGTLEPRKNHARLIRAFGRARLDCDLLVAGARGWLCGETERAAAETPRVRLLGRVSDAELRTLLAGADALCYPSRLEGFGLPVLEGMAAGRAVLTSRIEPLAGLAGDAALLVDPEDEEEMAEALRRLACDAALRAELGARGRERARRYTWERCAEATLQAYGAVLGRREARAG